MTALRDLLDRWIVSSPHLGQGKETLPLSLVRRRPVLLQTGFESIVKWSVKVLINDVLCCVVVRGVTCLQLGNRV